MKNNKKHPLTFFREEGEKRKAMFQKGGYNMPKNELPKKFNGGPGSGMGRMAADDAAFDAMMNPPQTPPSSSLATLASEAARNAISNPNSYNVDTVNSRLTPTFSQSPYRRDAMEILERRTLLNNRLREEANRKKASGQKKKGGSVGRKK